MKKKVIAVISAIALFAFGFLCYIVHDDVLFFFQLVTDREVYEKSVIKPDYHLDSEHLVESPKEAYNDVMLTWFSSTGITIKCFDYPKFDIYEDANGWLYYHFDLSYGSDFEPVLGIDGNMTKDISIFETNDIWFTYSGVSVRSSRGIKYDILKDHNGWLYYSRFGRYGRNLTPVIDSDGNRTKSLSVFDTE